MATAAKTYASASTSISPTELPDGDDSSDTNTESLPAETLPAMPKLIPMHKIKREPGTEPKESNYTRMELDIPEDEKLVIDEVASKAMLKFAAEVKREVHQENGSSFDQSVDTAGSVDSSSVTLSDGTLLDGADSQYIVQKTCTKTICKYCAYQFTSPSEIQYHIQMHKRGKAPHTCSQCGKEYRTPSKLQRHVRVHSGERPYACDVCLKRFTRSDHVKQHMKTHQPQKQLNICRLCDMKFLRAQSLQQHLQQIHDIDCTFKCHRCGEVFESLENLNSHMQSHDPYNNEMINGMQKAKQDGATLVDGVAKFSLGPQKLENHNSSLSLSSHADCYETLSKDDTTASLEDLSDLSYSYITEHMLQSYNKKEEDESNLKKEQEQEQHPSGDLGGIKKTATITSHDGLSMFIVPSDPSGAQSPSSSNNENENDDENDESLESVNNGSKDGRDDDENSRSKAGEQETKDFTKVKENSLIAAALRKDNLMADHSKMKTDTETHSNENDTHKNSTSNTQTVTHPTVLTTIKEGLIPCQPNAPMVSLIKSSPKISQMLREKVSGKFHPYTRPVDIQPVPTGSSGGLISKNNIVYTDSQGKANFMIIKPIQGLSVATTSVTNIPKLAPKPATPPAVSMATAGGSSAPKAAQPQMGKKILRCEHCCIWFDDIAMSSLHNTLHLADDSDPFTCPKCLKKLGNRLEFMAHLIYHLQPNMDI